MKEGWASPGEGAKDPVSCSCAACAAAASPKDDRERGDSAVGAAGAGGQAAADRRAFIREAAPLAGSALLGAIGFIVRPLAEAEGAPPLARYAATAVFAAAYLLAGWDVLRSAAKNIASGQVFDELFLMSVASLGAFAIGAMEEAIGVMIFYKIGEALQEAAAAKSRRSIRAVLALRPDKARVRRGEAWVECRPEDLIPGDVVLVRPGERVPVDGTVVSGAGSFDSSAMTGESAPRLAEPGERAMSGFIAREGALEIRAEKPASESSAARIVDMVENASKAKAKTELFITRFARWYTPAVVGMAVVVALAPPLLVPGQRLADWAYRALVMLVISCPCAFVLSVPLGYLGGLGGLARKGILVKGANVLDALAEAKTVVFDKTGTLTDGRFVVRSLEPADGFDEGALLSGAVAAGTHSNHPLAAALREAWDSGGRERPGCDSGSYSEIPGHGTVAKVDGREVLAGGDGLLHLRGIPHACAPARGTEVHVAIDGRYAGRIGVGDSLKADGKAAINRLAELGVRRIAMLTGDSADAAVRAASEAGIAEVHHGLLPEGKLERLESILGEERGRGSVLFVGDGINDAPVLARADAGVAMGSGADAAVESADVVLLGPEPSRVAEAIGGAKRTRAIVAQNIALSLAVKLAVIGLGALGLAAMWEAVIADVGVALLAVLNSTRALK